MQAEAYFPTVLLQVHTLIWGATVVLRDRHANITVNTTARTPKKIRKSL